MISEICLLFGLGLNPSGSDGGDHARFGLSANNLSQAFLNVADFDSSNFGFLD